ncbi:AsmA family protein, partial [Kaarinaea lacus]
EKQAGRVSADQTTTETPPIDKAVTTQGKQTAEQAQAMGALAMLAIDGLELKDGHIEWDDQQSGQKIYIDKLTLMTGPLALPAPVDVSLSMDLQLTQPKIKDHVEFKGKVIAKLDEHSIELKALQLNALGIALSGQLGINGLDTTPQASGHIQLASFSPRDLASKLEINLPDTRDSAVLKKAAADIVFTASPQEAKLNKLSLQLDDSEITGTASVKNFAVPAIRFNLDANEIDVDRYLPPPSKKTSASHVPPTPGSAATAATQLPLAPLRTLDIDGNLSLGKLTAVGAQLSTMKLGIKGQGGQIHLHPLEASLYDGRYDGDIRLDVRTNTPKVSVNEKLTTVNVGPLLKDVMGKELVSGTANIAAQLTSTGHELDTIKSTLNGTAHFSFNDGKVNGVNIGQMIREAYAKLKKKPEPPKTENATDFAEMTGSMTVTNGVIRNKDLNAKSPLLRIKGEGKVDLPRERVDYHVNAAIVESNEGQTGKELEELKSLIIPIKVTGKLTDPRFGLDLGPVLQKRAKEVIDTKIEKEKKEIKKRIEKDIKEKLEKDLKKKLGIKF